MLKKYIDSCSRFAKLEPDFDHTASWNRAFLMDIDWQTYLYDPQHNWIDRLDKMALRRFFDENVAMEAMAFVFERLKKDNYAKLNKFQGKSQPSTFLISVVRNLLEDYADHRFGTCEPPTWVKALGKIWCTIHKRLCCHREPKEQIVRALNHPQTADIIQQILQRHSKCLTKILKPEFVSMTTTDSDDDSLAFDERHSRPDDAQDLADYHQQQTQEQTLGAIAQLLGGGEQHASAQGLCDHALALSSQLRSALTLTPQQWLLLRLHYQEGVSINKAESQLGLKKGHGQYQHKKALEAIRSAFIQVGIE